MTIHAVPELLVSSFPVEETINAIDDRTCRAIHNLSVSERDGVIRIHGQSNTFYAKQLASEAVGQMHPELSIINQIDVN